MTLTAGHAAAIAAGGAVGGTLISEVAGKVVSERLLTRFPHLRGKPKARWGPLKVRPAGRHAILPHARRGIRKLASGHGAHGAGQPRDGRGRWASW